MTDFVINSTVNSSPNEKKTMAGFIGEKSGLARLREATQTQNMAE
jgi:hypothetical protein